MQRQGGVFTIPLTKKRNSTWTHTGLACLPARCSNVSTYLQNLGNEHFRQMQITVFFLFFYFPLTAVSLNNTQETLLQIPRSLSFAVYVKIHQRKNKICWLHVNGTHQLSNVHTVQDASAEIVLPMQAQAHGLTVLPSPNSCVSLSRTSANHNRWIRPGCTRTNTPSYSFNI